MSKFTVVELAKLNQPQLRELCDANNLEWSDKMSKAQLRELLLAVEDEKNSQVSEETKSEQEEVSEVSSEKDAKLTAFELELARRASKINTGVSNVAKEVDKTSAFELELARRASKHGNVVAAPTTPEAVASAFELELARRASKH